MQVKIERLINALIRSDNEAADDLLLEAISIGNVQEQTMAIDALVKRNTIHGLVGVIAIYNALPEIIQKAIVRRSRDFYVGLSEAGRSETRQTRLNAIGIIYESHLGKLAYVLSENLRDPDEELSKAGCDALVGMARWVSHQSRAMHQMGLHPSQNNLGLQMMNTALSPEDTAIGVETSPGELSIAYANVMEQRPEIESAIARALDVSKTLHTQEMLRAALLLCDHPGSKTLAILKEARHGGQQQMVRKLQQPPGADHVEAFLLGASHGHLRTHFGIAFSQITDAPVLDAMLRRTHWLKDHQLQLCMKQVSKGIWWTEADLLRDLETRTPGDAAMVAEWIVSSAMHDTIQDEFLCKIREQVLGSMAARLRLLRIAANRSRGATTDFIKQSLKDPDERQVRIAVREIARRRPAEFENTLLQMMSTAPDSVRRVIARSIGTDRL